MKKMTKAIICLILCFAVVFSLTSCEDFINDIIDDLIDYYSPPIPDGPGSTYEDLYDKNWADYDEMVEIVTRLRAHGTEVAPIPYFDCEEYGLDVKFTMTLPEDWSEGFENELDYFNRKLDKFQAVCVIFFEETSNEEIEKKGTVYAYFYDHITVISWSKDTVPEKPNGAEDIEIKYDHTGSSDYYSVFYNGKIQFGIIRDPSYGRLTDEQLNILEQTINIIE